MSKTKDTLEQLLEEIDSDVETLPIKSFEARLDDYINIVAEKINDGPSIPSDEELKKRLKEKRSEATSWPSIL